MKRILLRAELSDEHGGHIIAHTLELSDVEAFVETDVHLPLGAAVRLTLSFPRWVASIPVGGRVTGHRHGVAPGEPSGLELALTFANDEEQERLLAVLRTMSEPPATPSEEGFHVLLVEDNHLIRDMFSYGIRKYFRGREGNVVIDHAPDGAAAWQMLSDGDYDLAIVDYYLPVLNGAQLVERMRSEPRLAEMPVVAVSVGGSEARDATLAAGADLFLDKPLVLKDLFVTLERLNSHGASR
jgi:CheY-like chemotaxis protein